jgi:hypothetical protein
MVDKSIQRITKDEEKEIIEDVFGKGVSLSALKTMLETNIAGGNRLLDREDVKKDVDNILKPIGFLNSSDKFKNRIEALKNYFDRNSKIKKLPGGPVDVLKEGKSTRKVKAKDGSRTKVRGTGAATKGFRKARLS